MPALGREKTTPFALPLRRLRVLPPPRRSLPPSGAVTAVRVQRSSRLSQRLTNCLCSSKALGWPVRGTHMVALLRTHRQSCFVFLSQIKGQCTSC